MDNDPPQTRARVRLAESLDSVFLVPDREHVSVLASIVRSAEKDIHGVRAKQTAEGLRIPSLQASRLIDVIEDRVELEWTSEARRFVENRRWIESKHSRVQSTLSNLVRSGVKLASKMLGESANLDVLDPHQVVNVAAMTLDESPGLCVFDEQGTGKTVTLIYAFDVLVARNEADTALIIAPKSMVGEWPRDIANFTHDLYKTVVVTGSTIQKRRQLSQRGDIFITNFETVVSMESEIRAMLRARPGRTVLVIDESFYVKSLDAKRTQALRRIREWAGRTYVLCGTPAPNSPIDLIQQFNLVDFGYCFSELDVSDDQHLSRTQIQTRIEERGLFLRHLKVDVLPNLPEKCFKKILIPMETEQCKLYRGLLHSLRDETESIDANKFKQERQHFLARRSALLQICSNPKGVFEHYEEIPAKLIALDAIVKEIVGEKKSKLVIWSFYTRALAVIAERYRTFGVVRYDGSITDISSRRNAVEQFQEDDETMIFVANPAAAGAGLTLHRAQTAVYESFSPQPAHYLQSLDRIHRRGQTHDVEYLILLCAGTMEVTEFDRLRQKETLGQSLFNDRVTDPLNHTTFLADLHRATDDLNHLVSK